MNAVCGDGQRANYTLRNAPKYNNATVWVLRLEGGGLCFNEESCLARLNESEFMHPIPSRLVKPFDSWMDQTGGILSSDKQLNPNLYQTCMICTRLYVTWVMGSTPSGCHLVLIYQFVKFDWPKNTDDVACRHLCRHVQVRPFSQPRGWRARHLPARERRCGNEPSGRRPEVARAYTRT